MVWLAGNNTIVNLHN